MSSFILIGQYLTTPVTTEVPKRKSCYEQAVEEIERIITAEIENVKTKKAVQKFMTQLKRILAKLKKYIENSEGLTDTEKNLINKNKKKVLAEVGKLKKITEIKSLSPKLHKRLTCFYQSMLVKKPTDVTTTTENSQETDGEGEVTTEAASSNAASSEEESSERPTTAYPNTDESDEDKKPVTEAGSRDDNDALQILKQSFNNCGLMMHKVLISMNEYTLKDSKLQEKMKKLKTV